MLYCNH